MPQNEAMLKSEEIKPVATAIIKLCLSGCFSKSVSQSVENIKLKKNLWIDLKMGLACSTG